MTKKILSDEISNICKAHTEFMDIDNSSHLDMLLQWVKVICGNYDVKMESLTSLVDGKAMWCLLDFYFRKELHCPCSLKDLNNTNEESIVSMRDTTDAVHNLVLSQKLTTLLGNFPEVLQICDILEYNGACNDRSVVILLVFLSSQLLVKKNKDKLNFHKLMGCHCQNPERKRVSMSSETAYHKEKEQCIEDGAMKFKTVQAWWQEMAKLNTSSDNLSSGLAILPSSADNCSSESYNKVNATVIIQCHLRRVIQRKKYLKTKEAVLKIQLAWKKFLASEYWQTRCTAAIRIQSHIRGWIQKRNFLNHKQAVMKIQSVLRALRYLKDLHEYKMTTKSAIIVQSHVRGWIARKEACRHWKCIILVQSYCRSWLARRSFLCQKQAALRLQNAFRVMMCRYEFQCYRHAATEIQRFVRGKISRNRLLGSSSLHLHASNHNLTSGHKLYSTELSIVLKAIVKLQRWWKSALDFRLRKEAAVVIQSHIRGFICRQKTVEQRRYAIVIQAHWKGYIARKNAKKQLVDLRLRIQKSAATLEDSMRIMNRLIAALKELKSMKNVSGILYNCATLNMATTHSQKCCERLVEEGAVEILLCQISAVTRSIPDQEVLKHCLSTLRNLARYTQLADVLIDHRGSIETIFRELLRNKEEGYFIACELLKKLCTRPRGIAAIRGLASMLKRLQSLVEDLTRKANHEKRNNRGVTPRDITERRLREAIELVNLITYG
ncbi:unnamed protein product [Amaranthus hypochondriacus]